MLELEKEIDRIKQRLEADQLFLKKVQITLREYVIDKKYPINDRFEIWSKWCDKKEHGWIIHERDVPVIGKWVDEGVWEFDRGGDYDWKYFYDAVVDEFEWPGSYPEIRKDISSLDDFKELLIEINFGSFTMDW